MVQPVGVVVLLPVCCFAMEEVPNVAPLTGVATSCIFLFAPDQCVERAELTVNSVLLNLLDELGTRWIRQNAKVGLEDGLSRLGI